MILQLIKSWISSYLALTKLQNNFQTVKSRIYSVLFLILRQFWLLFILGALKTSLMISTDIFYSFLSCFSAQKPWLLLLKRWIPMLFRWIQLKNHENYFTISELYWFFGCLIHLELFKHSLYSYFWSSSSILAQVSLSKIVLSLFCAIFTLKTVVLLQKKATDEINWSQFLLFHKKNALFIDCLLQISLLMKLCSNLRIE